MARRKTSILQEEIDQLDLCNGVQAALSGLGISMAHGTLFAGSLPVVVVMGIGESSNAVAECMQVLFLEIEKVVKSGQSFPSGPSSAIPGNS